MPDKIGRFDIVSQLAHTEHSAVYKASDPETGNFVALKAVMLEPLGEQAATLVKEVLVEAEAAKALNSHNVAALYGAGEMDGKLCALMEYVQGNSIATMLERKEGFSIWDLQDIARQACQGLDHAHVHKVFHHSLEPAKIMVQWDGVTRILGFGVSTTGDYAAQAQGKARNILHYMSPEQLQGDPLDARSNLFSMGAILYEMVTERKAFAGEEAEQVRQAILEMMPTPPNQINPRIHPGLSTLIMKALAKAPEERFQSGQELINELEKCKDAPAAKKSTMAKPVSAKAAVQKTEPKPAAMQGTVAKPAKAESTPQHFAAAAGRGADSATVAGRSSSASPESGSDFITNCVKATIESVSSETAQQSTATVEPQEVQAPEVQAARFSVDPMMDESRQAAAKGPSFSDVEELPPLKEAYVPPPAPKVEQPEVLEEAKPSIIRKVEPDKPKVPPREMAKKAVSEIKKTPPKLFVYSLSAAVALILLVVGGLVMHFRSSDADDDNAPATTSAKNDQASTAPASAVQPTQVVPEQTEAPPAVSVTPKFKGSGKKKVKSAPEAVPLVTTGQLSFESTPAGARIQVDGQDVGSVTPFNMTSVLAGQHTVTISKDGYAPQTRTIEVNAGSGSLVSVQLALLLATVSVTSDPPGSEIYMDGKDMGKVTPAQFPVDKPGSHTFDFKKQGYLDASQTANLQIGQTSHLSAKLQELGNTDDIKVGGKFKKLFGGAGDVAGMGKVSVKTQPKGAQVAVNNRMVDKMSPVEFYLNPGTYVVDVTLSGYKDIHKVINVDKNGKVSIDETMEHE